MNPFPRGEDLPEGFYEIAYEVGNDYMGNPYSTKLVFVRHSTKKDDGSVRSYFITTPCPDSTCSNAGQYVWPPSYSNHYTLFRWIRPLLPFEIIDLKFKMYGWCRMSKEPFFNREYLNGTRKFIRR